MSGRFVELHWADTRLGTLVLRRRFDPVVETDVYEVKLGDEYLMSSLFTAAERQLAELALAELPHQEADVMVAGLGLGYTAAAALADPRVRSLTVVEALPEVIEWHRRGLLPDAAGLAADPRVRLCHDDFFALVLRTDSRDGSEPAEGFHAVLVDVDHSPRHVLHPSHAAFYRAEGLRRVGRLLRPDGVLAVWSDDPPDAAFQAGLAEVFSTARAEVVEFANPFTGGTSSNTVYVARLDHARPGPEAG